MVDARSPQVGMQIGGGPLVHHRAIESVRKEAIDRHDSALREKQAVAEASTRHEETLQGQLSQAHMQHRYALEEFQEGARVIVSNVVQDAERKHRDLAQQ